MCRLPEAMPALDADLYQTLRGMHCAEHHASHDCIGVLTLDRAGVSLRCKCCGDARRLYPAKETPDAVP